MLERLEIRNYALIEDSIIEFDERFTVISGETGAGKSIILGALSLLFGNRADVSVIRSGAESVTVAASFYLPTVPEEVRQLLDEKEISLEDDTLILRRTVRQNGRSTNLIGGSVATLGELRTVSSALFEISAQRDHYTLLLPARQLAVLDAYGELESKKESYQATYTEHRSLKAAYTALEETLASSERESEYLRFATEEIAAIDPQPDEDEALSQEITIIGSAEALHDAVQKTAHLLHDDNQALSLLHRAISSLKEGARIDSSLNGLVQRLETTTIEVQDIYESSRDYLASITYSAEELEALQQRLVQIQRLKKKYGPSLERVLSFYQESCNRLAAQSRGTEGLTELAREVATAKERMVASAAELTEKRKAAAARLAAAVAEKLQRLGMQEASFVITFDAIPLSSSGGDSVVYEISANPGVAPMPIKQVASGGELSRILLAIKTSLASADTIGTLFFDEVDAGIGGAVAVSVAEELRALSGRTQIVVITHLASIASYADHHLVVHKEVESGVSRSKIAEVTGEARTKEVARMLSGDAHSAESLEHASLLLHQRD